MQLELHTIWGWLPVPVIGVRKLPRNWVGLSLGPIVFLRDDYLLDRPTVEHELVHCRQFWRGFGPIHLLRYIFDLTYRMHAELEAFAVELRTCSPRERAARMDEAARALATCYGLDLKVEEARSLLEFLSEGDETGSARNVPLPVAGA